MDNKLRTKVLKNTQNVKTFTTLSEHCHSHCSAATLCHTSLLPLTPYWQMQAYNEGGSSTVTMQYFFCIQKKYTTFAGEKRKPTANNSDDKRAQRLHSRANIKRRF